MWHGKRGREGGYIHKSSNPIMLLDQSVVLFRLSKWSGPKKWMHVSANPRFLNQNQKWWSKEINNIIWLSLEGGTRTPTMSWPHWGSKTTPTPHPHPITWQVTWFDAYLKRQNTHESQWESERSFHLLEREERGSLWVVTLWTSTNQWSTTIEA